MCVSLLPCNNIATSFMVFTNTPVLSHGSCGWFHSRGLWVLHFRVSPGWNRSISEDRTEASSESPWVKDPIPWFLGCWQHSGPRGSQFLCCDGGCPPASLHGLSTRQLRTRPAGEGVSGTGTAHITILWIIITSSWPQATSHLCCVFYSLGASPRSPVLLITSSLALQ